VGKSWHYFNPCLMWANLFQELGGGARKTYPKRVLGGNHYVTGIAMHEKEDHQFNNTRRAMEVLGVVAVLR